MLDIREVKLGDLLTFEDGSGPVKVIEVWPYAITVQLSENTKTTVYVNNPDNRSLNMKRDKAHELLFKD